VILAAWHQGKQGGKEELRLFAPMRGKEKAGEKGGMRRNESLSPERAEAVEGGGSLGPEKFSL